MHRLELQAEKFKVTIWQIVGISKNKNEINSELSNGQFGINNEYTSTGLKPIPHRCQAKTFPSTHKDSGLHALF
jgi:hypothetical protein